MITREGRKKQYVGGSTLVPIWKKISVKCPIKPFIPCDRLGQSATRRWEISMKYVKVTAVDGETYMVDREIFMAVCHEILQRAKALATSEQGEESCQKTQETPGSRTIRSTPV